MTETTTTNDLTAVRADLRAAGKLFADRLADLVPAAEAVADLEARLRAAENAAGVRNPGPVARELAYEMLCGRLQALRPFLAFGTAESADRAQECLSQVDERKLRTVQ